MTNKALLSICIPTWNRSNLLSDSLERLLSQISGIAPEDLEIFVSDNASDDDTPQIVDEYVSKGLPIIYNRNETNIGADRNFVRCMEMANGKYIWLLGDDDFLKQGALRKIIDILKQNDLGLLHLCAIAPGQNSTEVAVCDDIAEYLTHVSYYSTFISGNIFNRSALTSVSSPERYMRSFLVQMPFFIDAMLTHKKNAFIGINTILDAGVDGDNNGGYNFFEVFVKNYLTIWRERLEIHEKNRKLYDFICDDIFVKFTFYYTNMLLFKKQNVIIRNHENGQKGWYTEKAWKILFSFYWNKKYFYSMIFKMFKTTASMYLKNSMHR